MNAAWFVFALAAAYVILSVFALKDSALKKHHPALEPFDKFGETLFWGKLGDEKLKLSRSPLILCLYAFSSLVRATSLLQVIKIFAKKRKLRIVPAWWIEFYMSLWIVSGIAFFVSVEGHSANFWLIALCCYRIVHTWHGNLYYNLLRTIYFNHEVHSYGRDLIIAAISFFELALWHAILVWMFKDELEGGVAASKFSIIYYCFTTMLTVGYGDLHAMAGKFPMEAISMSLMLTGVTIVGLCLTRMAGFLRITGQLIEAKNTAPNSKQQD